MQSMTGFGQATLEDERLRVTVNLRSVNHRFLDLALRLPENLRSLEPALRDLLAAHLHRGRVEIFLEVVLIGPQRLEIALDEELVQGVQELSQNLLERGVIASHLEMSDLLRLGAITPMERRDLTEEDEATVLKAVESALDQLQAARSVEGGKLQQALVKRLDLLEDLRRRLEEHQEGIAETILNNLRGRLQELLADAAIDEHRLAQEAALLVERNDVREELDRLESHLEHFRDIVGQSGSIGKRLDFLAQEIFRELNTIGSKCRDSAMTRFVVESKVFCEQLREQIQNVE